MVRRLLAALILVVILSLALATPVLAGGPEDKQGPGNMPEGGEVGLDKAVTGIEKGNGNGNHVSTRIPKEYVMPWLRGTGDWTPGFKQ